MDGERDGDGIRRSAGDMTSGAYLFHTVIIILILIIELILYYSKKKRSRRRHREFWYEMKAFARLYPCDLVMRVRRSGKEVNENDH